MASCAVWCAWNSRLVIVSPIAVSLNDFLVILSFLNCDHESSVGADRDYIQNVYPSPKLFM